MDLFQSDLELSTDSDSDSYTTQATNVQSEPPPTSIPKKYGIPVRKKAIFLNDFPKAPPSIRKQAHRHISQKVFKKKLNNRRSSIVTLHASRVGLTKDRACTRPTASDKICLNTKESAAGAAPSASASVSRTSKVAAHSPLAKPSTGKANDPRIGSYENAWFLRKATHNRNSMPSTSNSPIVAHSMLPSSATKVSSVKFLQPVVKTVDEKRPDPKYVSDSNVKGKENGNFKNNNEIMESENQETSKASSSNIVSRGCQNYPKRPRMNYNDDSSPPHINNNKCLNGEEPSPLSANVIKSNKDLIIERIVNEFISAENRRLNSNSL